MTPEMLTLEAFEEATILMMTLFLRNLLSSSKLLIATQDSFFSFHDKRSSSFKVSNTRFHLFYIQNFTLSNSYKLT